MTSTKEAQEQLNLKRSDSSIKFVSKYAGDKVKHTFICTRCNYAWVTTPNTLKRKQSKGCPSCSGTTLSKKEDKKIVINSNMHKLRDNATLSHKQAVDTFVNPSHYESMKKNLEVQKTNMKNLEASYNFHEQEYKKACPREWHPLLIALLFPFWIISGISYSKLLTPYRNRKQQAYSKFLSAETKYKQVLNELNIYELEKECYLNISRIREKVDLKYGGDTKLYYVKIRHSGKAYYKIGITINSVEERYSSQYRRISSEIEKIIFQVNLLNARELERLIINTYKKYLANDRQILSAHNGYTEVFISDILGLD